MKKEAEILYEQQKQRGYEEGTAQSQIELENQLERLEAEYQAQVQQIEDTYNEKQMTMENDIVDAVIAVFNKVFHIQYDNKKEILLSLIHNTLLYVETGKEFRIRVSNENHKFIEEHIPDIKEKVGNDITIDVVNDMKLESESCIIETDFGIFDCGIDTQLSNLIKDIKSLCG
ncbi:MAG: hypothetical protein IKJ01_01205 [Lachnospiraceae bacterium]|nr:hypothetical protein [Lachnospiraceae bacterium]